MAHVPTREELYKSVNEEFYETHPSAPRPLTLGARDAELRKSWIEIRDRLLYREIDRIYWDEYPNAPREIDPDNAEHHPFQRAWWHIHDSIMQNIPQPPEEAAELDTSYLRELIVKSMNYYEPKLWNDLVDKANEWGEQVISDAEQFVANGDLVPGGPQIPTWFTEVTSEYDASQKMAGTAWVMLDAEGRLFGDFNLQIEGEL
jgi:hypothetical protein